MEASTVGTEIENGSEDVDIKHEPLEPYVEYPVSLFSHMLKCICAYC